MSYRRYKIGAKILWGVLFCGCSTRLAAQSMGLTPSLYMAVNATNDSTDKGMKKVIGESYELGGSMFLERVGLDLYMKRIKYDKSAEDENGLKTSDLRFTDALYGTGLRLIGKGFSVKFGRASHNIVCEQKVEQATKSDLPHGREVGNYAGAGMFLTLPGNFDIQLDYTYFSLPSYHYKVDEVSLGVRFDFGAPLGGGSSGGGKGK